MLNKFGRCSALVVLACALGAGGGRAEDALVVKGRVIDARTGEAIAKALVRVRDMPIETRTDAAGAFELRGVPEGAAELYVSTVGYGLVKKPITVVAPGPTDVTVLLGQDAILRSEEVEVTTAAFEETEKGAAAEDTLDNLELRNLSSVLADDTLRSVQTLPGVATGDDFNATFSVRGFGFENVGLYIDGVLAASPFHTIRDVNDGYSLSILNGDMVEAVSLVSSAAPARYGDRVGAALNVQTRDGSFERRVTRAHLGATGVSFSSESPLGASKNTSWLVAGRKSFLDYVINRIEEDPSFVVGYHDLQAKLAHRAGPHLLSLFALYGDAVWKENEPGQSRNSIARADAGTQLVNARWRYTPGARLALTASAYATRETGRNSNRGQEQLFRSNAWQTGLRGDATLKLGAHALEGGLLLRRMSEDSAALVADGPATPLRAVYAYDQPSWQPGGYLQDTLSLLGEKLRVTLGGRFDSWSVTGDTVFLPRASAVLSVSKRSRLSAGVGGYAQFPSLGRLLGESSNPELAPERSSHYLLAYERLLGAGLRVRVEAYQQQERDRLFVPGSEFRLVDGVLTRPLANARFQNSLAGRSRGVEFLLQRRSANGLAGWISYAYGHAFLYTHSDTFADVHTFTYPYISPWFYCLL